MKRYLSLQGLPYWKIYFVVIASNWVTHCGYRNFLWPVNDCDSLST